MRKTMLVGKKCATLLPPPPTLFATPTTSTNQPEYTSNEKLEDSPENTEPTAKTPIGIQEIQTPEDNPSDHLSYSSSLCGPVAHQSVTPIDPSVSVPIVIGCGVISTNKSSFINACSECRDGSSHSSDTEVSNCPSCNPLLTTTQNNIPRKFSAVKKMPFAMSAFIFSGVGMFLLCTVLSVTVQTTEAEINRELTQEAITESEGKHFHHHSHHGGLKIGLGHTGHGPPHHDDLSAISVNKYSDEHKDVTRLELKPFKQVFITRHEIVFPIMSYELVQKIKYLIRLPLELIQWIIPHFILLKEFFVTLSLFLLKLLDVRDDFKSKFEFDENDLDLSFEH